MGKQILTVQGGGGQRLTSKPPVVHKYAESVPTTSPTGGQRPMHTPPLGSSKQQTPLDKTLPNSVQKCFLKIFTSVWEQEARGSSPRALTNQTENRLFLAVFRPFLFPILDEGDPLKIFQFVGKK